MRATGVGTHSRRLHETVIGADVGRGGVAGVRGHEHQPELITRVQTRRLQRPVMRHHIRTRRRRLQRAAEHRRHPIQRQRSRLRGCLSFHRVRAVLVARRDNAARRTQIISQAPHIKFRARLSGAGPHEQISRRRRTRRSTAPRLSRVRPRIRPEPAAVGCGASTVQPEHRHIKIRGVTRVHPQMRARIHTRSGRQRLEPCRIRPDRVMGATRMQPRRRTAHKIVIHPNIRRSRVTRVRSQKQQPELTARRHPLRRQPPILRDVHRTRSIQRRRRQHPKHRRHPIQRQRRRLQCV